METKRNLKYYTAAAVSVVMIVGVVVSALAAICLCINQLRLYGLIGIIIGIGILIFGSSGKSNDTDISYQTATKVKEIDEKAMKKFEVYEHNFLKSIQPVHMQGYVFDASEGLLIKRGSDGIIRTPLYNGAVLFFTKEKMYIYKSYFSLIDETVDEDTGLVFQYTKLANCGIDEFERTYKRGNALAKMKYYEFYINGTDGNELFRMTIEYGADSDKAVSDINHVIKVRTEAIEERRRLIAEDKAARAAAIAANS